VSGSDRDRARLDAAGEVAAAHGERHVARIAALAGRAARSDGVLPAGQVNIPYAVILSAGLFVGAFVGAHLAGEVSDVALKRAFGGLLLIVAGKLLLG